MSAFSRCLSLALAASVLFSITGRAQQKPAAAAPAPVPAGASAPAATAAQVDSPVEKAEKLTAQAVMKMKNNDGEGGLALLNQALLLNPQSTGAYVLRASIYTQRKDWPKAEDDFKAAAKIAPTNAVLKFNLVEIKFMQKEYDLARPGFLALETDPDMGDFAAYKVFLCDLFGGHEALARKELNTFNDAMTNPSYYFSNAAWYLVHRDLKHAREWLLSASRIYPPEKNAYYAQSLRDLGYLPIPQEDDVVKPNPAGAPTAPAAK